MTDLRSRNTLSVGASAKPWLAGLALAGVTLWASASQPERRVAEAAATPGVRLIQDFDKTIAANAAVLMKEGQKTFRDDTFGSEAFWGEQLQLHRALVGSKHGGVGDGVSARQALALGLKVDAERVPKGVADGIKKGTVDLDSPDATLALLQADAVVGVKGIFDGSKRMTSMGFTCALCHSTVDDSFAKGIGRRMDGWPNRDLDVGKIVSIAPRLDPFTKLLGVDEPTVKSVLLAWGPGKYDAELDQDGKGMRPDGKSSATLIPAAFGLAGQTLNTYNGWGSVPYWNAYVANTQMHGKGTFVDRRLANPSKYPVAAHAGFANKRDGTDLITSKLAALHFYQLAIPAPTPPDGSFDTEAASRGEKLFAGKARCTECHVPPLFSEPGWPMHTGKEIGIDDFQASRAPDGMYRTTPLRGLFARTKGGFYHDGRFADLDAVVRHYEPVLGFSLTEAERRDLIEYLKSL